MGYYTTFKMRTLNQVDLSLSILKEMDKDIFYGLNIDRELKTHDNFELGVDIGSTDEVKWYDHEDDVKELSKKFPNSIFELTGEGEESVDLWVKYFKDGKMQVCGAKIVYDDYDESKIK